MWHWAMKNSLYAQNKFVFVDGSLSKPPESVPEESAWIKCNSMVVAWIFNALSMSCQRNYTTMLVFM
uniref:Retrotransposon Copia-like N-terminal domain-containing protein n=1 Tax=Nelumbo nucifera TaxID=4432 RepID=A0A822YB80_NELNU|nr:TPA_asm: hypothetical protein HUJ06_028266 [Nelumbo nucifera]